MYYDVGVFEVKRLTSSAAQTRTVLAENRHSPPSKLQTINLIVHITGMENMKLIPGKPSSFLNTTN